MPLLVACCFLWATFWTVPRLVWFLFCPIGGSDAFTGGLLLFIGYLLDPSRHLCQCRVWFLFLSDRWQWCLCWWPAAFYWPPSAWTHSATSVSAAFDSFYCPIGGSDALISGLLLFIGHLLDSPRLLCKAKAGFPIFFLHIFILKPLFFK